SLRSRIAARFLSGVGAVCGLAPLQSPDVLRFLFAAPSSALAVGSLHWRRRSTTPGPPPPSARAVVSKTSPGALYSQCLQQQTRSSHRPKPFFDPPANPRSEEHTSELQSLRHLVCRLLLEKKKKKIKKKKKDKKKNKSQ